MAVATKKKPLAPLAFKKTFINTFNFTEAGMINNVFIPDDSPIACHYFRFYGTIVVATAGTTLFQTTLWPSILNLLGTLTQSGNVIGGLGSGRQIKGIPFWALWWKNFTENSVAPLNAGSTLPTAITATTYNIDITIPVEEFDPKWSIDAQHAAMYRGVRYGRVQWQINCGQFAPVTLSQPDTTAYVVTAGTPAYTVNLKMDYSVDYVTNYGMTKGDACMDLAFEYLPFNSFGANISSVNGIQMNLTEFQDRIDMFNTAVAASGQETGVNNLAVGNGGLMDTKFGGQIYDQFNTSQIQSADQKLYFSGGLTWNPTYTGIYTIDQCGRSTQGTANSKTFLGTSGTPYVDAWPGSIPAGATTQSLRFVHTAYNLSAAMKAAIGTFGPWGGRAA